MIKIIMVSFAAIAIFTRAVELGTPPVLAVVLAAGFGVSLYKLYEHWDKLEREHEEKRKRCVRELRSDARSATNAGTYHEKQSNRSTYARYATGHSAVNRVAKELQSGEGAEERCSSGTVSEKKPIRKIIGISSYDYYSPNNRRDFLWEKR